LPCSSRSGEKETSSGRATTSKMIRSFTHKAFKFFYPLVPSASPSPLCNTALLRCAQVPRPPVKAARRMLKTNIAPLSLLALAAGCAAYVPAAPLGLRASPWSRSKVRENAMRAGDGSRVPSTAVARLQSMPWARGTLCDSRRSLSLAHSFRGTSPVWRRRLDADSGSGAPTGGRGSTHAGNTPPGPAKSTRGCQQDGRRSSERADRDGLGHAD
jgi:hypothetical protein